MAETRRLLQWGLLLTALMLAVGGIGIYLMYQAALQGERRDLHDIASSQAHLIRAVVEFDRQHSPDFPGVEPLIAEGGAAATLSQIRDAFSRYPGLGRTGELVLGYSAGNSVVIFLHQRGERSDIRHRIPADDPRAEPMKRALAGESGAVIAQDYAGQRVLAAYEPLKAPGWGLVAKRSLAEIRAPYLRAAALAGGGGLVLIALAGWGFSRVNDPLIRRLRQSRAELEEERHRLRTVLDTLPVGVWAVDESGHVFLHNAVGDALWGRSDYSGAPAIIAEFRGWDPDTGRPLAPEDWPVHRVLHNGERVEEEDVQVEAFDGQKRTLRQWAVPLPDEGGIRGALVVAQDVSHLVSMQRLLERNERVLELVLDQLPAGIALTDEKGHFVLTNAADRRIWGLNRIGRHFAEDAVPARWEQTAGATGQCDWPLHEALERQHPVKEVIATLGGGTPEEQILTFSAAPIYDGNGHLFGAVEMTQDITQRRLAEAERRTLANAVRQTGDAIFLLDTLGNITYINPAFTTITGYTEGEAYGRSLDDLVDGESISHRNWAQVWPRVAAGVSTRKVAVNRRKDGERFFWDVTLAPLKAENGELTGLVGTGTDLTEAQEIRDQLYHASRFDPLTDLPNRTHLMENLEAALARGTWSHRVTALVLLDLEQFTLLNDTLGHEAGDQILREVANRLTASVRSGDVVARTGDDAFAVLLEDVARTEDLPAVVAEISASLHHPFWLADRSLQINFSAGVAEAPEDANGATELHRAAETALLNARQDPSEELRYFAEDMTTRAHRQQTLEAGLRQALDNGELFLHFQPQIDLASGRLRGQEALLRWNHPDWGAISPAEFVPVAERAGLIRPIGEWVLHQALAWQRHWQDAGLEPGIIGVNLSALQVTDPDLPRKLETALASSGVNPKGVELEVTETALMARVEQGADSLERLRGLGVGLAADDFGTGYSSLAYLASLPLDTLKIDHTFIASLELGPEGNNVIVRSIISLAHTLGLTVIAEGVETAEQLAFLRGEGCDVIQGFLLGRPVSAEQVPELLARADWLAGVRAD